MEMSGDIWFEGGEGVVDDTEIRLEERPDGG